MTKMDPEYKAEWLKRLRSGEYKQGRGFLHVDGKYCCLGVLCEIGVERGELDATVSTKRSRPPGTLSYRDKGRPATWSSTISLPPAFSEALGLEIEGGRVEVDGHSPALSELNDDYGYTFPEIADLIEEQL